MNNFTMHIIKAAAMTLVAAVCITVQAAGPKRVVQVQKAKKQVVITDVNSDVTPAPLKIRPNNASAAQRDILIDEDFSKVTGGSMETPDTTKFLASSYYEPGIFIDPSMTKDGTWAGESVYAAGGALYLKTYNPMIYAALMTPLGDYSGEITLTFKVKAIPCWIVYNEDPETGEEIWGLSRGSTIGVQVCRGGYTSSQLADTDLEDGSGYYTTRLYENQGWTEIELHFNNYSGDSDGYICFFTEGAVLIDDVKVTSAPTFLAAPKVVGVTDFQADRFTIEWQPLRKAFEYYVDLYKMTYTSDTDGAFSEDFENYTAPQEGWGVTSSEISPDKGMDGSKAMVMYDRDTLTTPENGATYKTMDFYMKFVTHYDDPYMSMATVYVDGLTESGWKTVAYIYASYFIDGDIVRLSDEIYGFANTYKAIRIRPGDMEEGEYILVDNIDIATNRPFRLERVFGENSSDWGDDSNDTYYDYTDGTSYTFTGLDPETEYYYSVRGHYVFTFSDKLIYHAFGVCSPEVLPASNIDSHGSFTANWNLAPKATGYTVEMFGVTKVEEDDADFILLEETFDKINDEVTSATDWRSPEILGNDDSSRLDQYTALPGWTGVGNTIAQGMLGCESSSYILTEIVTPEIYVGNDDEIRVYVKAYGGLGDQLILRVDGKSYFVPFEQSEEGTGYINGLYSLPVTSEFAQIVMFTSNYGAFMLDEIRFTQAVNKGDVVITPIAAVDTDSETTSYMFTGLDGYGFDTYGYYVTSHFELEGKSTTSQPSETVVVNLQTGDSHVTTGMDSAKADAGVSEVARYSLDGRKLSAPQKGIDILRMSDGTTRKVIVK